MLDTHVSYRMKTLLSWDSFKVLDQILKEMNRIMKEMNRILEEMIRILKEIRYIYINSILIDLLNLIWS